MITNVTVPARLCKCDLCSYDWVSLANLPPTHCQNRSCRSRKWNGVKPKKVPEKKPQVVLPKVIKLRGGNDDIDEF